MKKSTRLFVLLLAMVLAISLLGCGASSKMNSGAGASFDAATEETAPAEIPMIGYHDSPVAAEEDYSFELPMADPGNQIASAGTDADEAASYGGANDGSAPADMSEKIIYNSQVTLETTEFDDTLEKVAALVRELGGYMESTSISGSNYNSIARGNAGTRSAYYEIRIPSANFSQLNSDLSALGNVPYNRTYTENITTQYYDVQSRLNAYKVQEDRLLEMLAIAETVEDMLSIQQQLTEVQYEIDSLTGTLRYYDNQVNYSTVDLTVEEVREYTPSPTVTLTYWERMRQEFGESLRSTGRFFTESFLWLVTSLPWLIPLAAGVTAVIWLLRRRIANSDKRTERRAAKREARLEKKARKKGIQPEAPSLSEQGNDKNE